MSAGDIAYRVYTYPSGAQSYEITGAVISLEWGELADEVAGKAVLTLAANIDGVKLSEAIRLNVYMSILADGKTVFSGIIWDYTLESARRIKLICYDKLIYLTHSRDNAYYPAGCSTERVLSSICGRWGIELKYTYPSVKHARLNYRAQTVAQQIIGTLDAGRAINGENYMLRLEGDTLHIGRRGETDARYTITDATAIAYSHRRTLDRLVTRVIVVDSSDGPVKTRATLDGDTSLGILQEVISNAGVTLSDAKTQAKQVLDERGAPEELIALNCADIPSLRRGDRVRIELGSLSGEYDVTGITHSGERSMELEVEKA